MYNKLLIIMLFMNIVQNLKNNKLLLNEYELY